MKKIFNPLVPFALGFSFNSFDDPDGMRLFNENKCFKCYSVSTVGIKAENETGKMAGGDLVNLAENYKSELLNQYLKKEVEIEVSTHKKPLKGTDEELQALVDWLLERKS